jgi:hypothetical protein
MDGTAWNLFHFCPFTTCQYSAFGVTSIEKEGKKLAALVLLAVLVLGAFLAVQASSLGQAFARGGHDDDGDDDDRGKRGRDEERRNHGVEDDDEQKVNKRLQIHLNRVLATVQSKLEVAGRESKVQFFFRTEPGITLKLHFKSEAESKTEENETKLDITVRFLQLREFQDLNSNGRLDAEEKVVQVLDLTKLKYSPITLQTIQSDNNLTGYRLEAHSLGNVTFQIMADLFPDQALVNGTRFGPGATKVTIGIRQFPFSGNGTKLALIIQASSTLKTEVESDVEKREVKIRSATAEGFFVWEGTAAVDGASQPVGSSTLREGGRIFIALTYPAGRDIVHDPLIGVRVQASKLAALVNTPPQTLSIAVAAGALVLALLLMARSRREVPIATPPG